MKFTFLIQTLDNFVGCLSNVNTQMPDFEFVYRITPTCRASAAYRHLVSNVYFSLAIYDSIFFQILKFLHSVGVYHGYLLGITGRFLNNVNENFS